MAGLPTDPDSSDPFSRYVAPEQMRWKVTGRQVTAPNFFGKLVTRVEEVRTRFSVAQGWHQETRFRRQRSAEIKQTQISSPARSSDVFDTSATI